MTKFDSFYKYLYIFHSLQTLKPEAKELCSQVETKLAVEPTLYIHDWMYMKKFSPNHLISSAKNASDFIIYIIVHI